MVGVLALAACGGSDDSSGGATDSSGVSVADAADESSDDDGAGSNDEAQESLDEAGVDLDLDELEETVTGFSTGEGGGVVTIDGVDYEFAAEICIVQGTDFVASGPSEGSDGTPAWIEVESSVGFDFDGDGTDDPSASVSVSVGQTELFGSGPDDQPRFYAESNVYDQSLTYTLDGGRMTGSGEMTDRNDYENYDKSYPVTFEASCS
jgi:hypothetical protein